MHKQTQKLGWITLVSFFSVYPVQASNTLAQSSNNDSIWMALFGLAVVGVLALYLASENVKNLTRQYQTMQAKQEEITLQQSVILGVIGERFETSTHGIRRHREVFEEQAQGSLDRDVIENEMVRFRRDEHLLVDALGDLNDFSQVRSGKLALEQKPFDLNDLLWELGQQVESHYFLKRNELVYHFDPELIGSAVGDAGRIEQILCTFLIELGQVTYDSTIILAMQYDAQKEIVTFDLLVPESEGGTQLLDEVFSDVQMEEEVQHGSHKLKSYLARELIRLIGGHLHAVADHAFGLHYQIELPLAMTIPSMDVRLHSGASTLIVAHNDPVALSVSDMLSGRSVPGADVISAEDAPPFELSVYTTVIITYAALTEAWTARLRKAQQEKPLRVVILKSGFQRTLPVPEILKDVRVLKLPILHEELAAAMVHSDLNLDRDRVAS